MFFIRFWDQLKGAMSQETGLEVPRCWPHYKRMFLVRAIDHIGVARWRQVGVGQLQRTAGFHIEIGTEL